ncbi:MAG: prepilin-type N-terminal cleavage/methylation domain-containing protein [Deltaproteobacteria bacterium]|nr:prepilin-type N-terminal cleavage/methylation domain-containing protein [Deltaproteobacteria bacterium]
MMMTITSIRDAPEENIPVGHQKSQCGFTLLEVLMAMALLAFGILAVGSMQVASIQANRHANHVTAASVFARDRMERVMALAYPTPPLLTDDGLTAGTYEDPEPPEGYTVNWTIVDGSAGGVTPLNTKLITVTVAHDSLQKDIVLMNIKPRSP